MYKKLFYSIGFAKIKFVYNVVCASLKDNPYFCLGKANLFIDIGNNQILLAQTVLDTDEFLEYMDMVKMLDEDDVYKIAMYIKQAKENLAFKEGEEKVVKKLLEDGFAVEDVLKYTSLTKSQIAALANSVILK